MPLNAIEALRTYKCKKEQLAMIESQLEYLEDIKGEELLEEISRAKAVTSIAQQIIANGSLVLESKKMMDDRLDANTKLPKMLEG